MRLPNEPKRETKKYHVVHTIFREGIYENPSENLHSFKTELADFLDSGYTVVGSGMNKDIVYAIVTKRV